MIERSATTILRAYQLERCSTVVAGHLPHCWHACVLLRCVVHLPGVSWTYWIYRLAAKVETNCFSPQSPQLAPRELVGQQRVHVREGSILRGESRISRKNFFERLQHLSFGFYLLDRVVSYPSLAVFLALTLGDSQSEELLRLQCFFSLVRSVALQRLESPIRLRRITVSSWRVIESSLLVTGQTNKFSELQDLPELALALLLKFPVCHLLTFFLALL